MREIKDSELMLNPDGSIFHLHLRPGQLANRVILVGDPDRVDRVAERFTKRYCSVQNREFRIVSGEYGHVPVSVVSTGIGTDNIDIVLSELDALVNIDFNKRCEKEELSKLKLLRLGTSGTLQPDISLGDMILSKISIGFDGLLNFYQGRNQICRTDLERRFCDFEEWNPMMGRPYFIESSETLNCKFEDITIPGMTVSAPGFYAPQGRWLRLQPSTPPDFNNRLSLFRAEGLRITNYEMESSALAGLAKLMGHEATTVCVAIAQRASGHSNTNYRDAVENMIDKCLEKIISV
ncbi:MAG: nucleoside phosphorylase [Rikenellaceae bacterium]|nr:nucleoside phosphorylase [Rikenellaceae bacterium]